MSETTRELYPKSSRKATKYFSSLYRDNLLRHREEQKKLEYAFKELGLIFYFMGSNGKFVRGFEARTEECDVYILVIEREPDIRVVPSKEKKALSILRELRNKLIEYEKLRG